MDGITNPSFTDFSYFFLLNVVGVSKFMFAMIALIGQVCSIIGVLIYENFLKKTEVRTVIMWNVILGVIGDGFNICLPCDGTWQWELMIMFLLYFLMLFLEQ